MFHYPLDEESELRLLELLHAEELLALIDGNREQLKCWLSWAVHRQSVEDIRDYIRQRLQRYADNGRPNCGIWRNGMLVGAIELMGENPSCAEIGYWLDADSQGRGLMTRSCRVLVGYAFGTLGVNRVEIRADPANTRSRAVAIRLGFTEEGTLRQVINMGDYFADRVVYAMLKEDWTALSNQ